MELNPELINLTYQHGVDPTYRTIRLSGDVDPSMLAQLHSGLMLLNTLGTEPITLFLTTNGGDIYSGMGIYDLIQLSPSPVSIVVIGFAFSMGAVILQGATAPGGRLLLPHSSIMLHVGSEALEGHSENVRRSMDFTTRIAKDIDMICLARMQDKKPSMTMKEFQEWQLLDRYLTARDAVRLGLADGTLGGTVIARGGRNKNGVSK